MTRAGFFLGHAWPDLNHEAPARSSRQASPSFESVPWTVAPCFPEPERYRLKRAANPDARTPVLLFDRYQ